MKKRLFTACAVVGLLLTTACRTAEKKTEPEPDNALKIGFVPSAEALPYMVAQEIGVYDSLRLQVRFVPMADTNERDTTFIRHATDGILLSLAESCRMQRKQVDIVPAVLFIGCTTFVISAVGVKVGAVFGARFQHQAELLGGVVLILMGIKILVEHLMAG